MRRSSIVTDFNEITATQLNQCPCGTLVLDPEGCVHSLNPALEKLLETRADTLIGKNSQALAGKGLDGLFKGEGLMHINASEPEHERWLQCNVIENAAATGYTLKYFMDVTELLQLREENELLHQQVQELAITDELTGLANRRALNRSLNAQVTRSRRYHNPLSLSMAVLVSAEGSQHDLSDEAILAASRFLRNRLRWADLIARWDHNQFFIVLPETGHDDAQVLMQKVVSEFSHAELPEEFASSGLQLRFGLGVWEKGDDTRRLMDKAAKALSAQFEHSAEAL
jgi:diguanylate cyclase (GGDEF)-like protein